MTAGKKLWRNRKERKEWARRLQSEDAGLRGPCFQIRDFASGNVELVGGPNADPVAAGPTSVLLSEPVKLSEMNRERAACLRGCGRGRDCDICGTV